MSNKESKIFSYPSGGSSGGSNAGLSIPIEITNWDSEDWGWTYTIEDNIVKGGLGSTILEMLNSNDINCKLRMFGYPKEFVKHASVSEIEKLYGLDADNIKNVISKEILYAKN